MASKLSLTDYASPEHSVWDDLRSANAAFSRRYPGEPARRQPVHTVYGGAHLFQHDAAQKLGGLARRAFDQWAPDPVTLATALQLPHADLLPHDAAALQFAHTVYRRVHEKLEREPIEDLRIDFEDGYGVRSEAEEDGHALAAAQQLALGVRNATLPPFIGIRIKALSEEQRLRAVRTLDLFVTAMVEALGPVIPDRFVITLPKVVSVAQVRFVVGALEHLEQTLGLRPRALHLELMVETSQSIVDAEGRCALPALVAAAAGRCVGAHFGTYDYTASIGITAAHQSMQHPACDFAKHMMQAAAAQTGVFLSDGATTTLPIAPHRPDKSGAPLSDAAREANRIAVHRAWKLHYDSIWHSLKGGFYQGWDLHPAQLPVRHAATFAFFLEGRNAAKSRLASFLEKAAQASRVGEAFDDAATGQGLLNYFLRALNCGALEESEVLDAGLTVDELRTKSFAKILETRVQRR